jgi:hypothetical protein
VNIFTNKKYEIGTLPLSYIKVLAEFGWWEQIFGLDFSVDIYEGERIRTYFFGVLVIDIYEPIK